MELYDHYFDANGIQFKIAKKDLETENALAYDYLKAKGYITVEPLGVDFLTLNITVSGIDVVEQL